MTTRDSAGRMHTRLFSQDVNYREDGEGPWKPIDLDLESASGGVVEPAAVDGDLQIPSSLASPVVLERDGSSFEVRLIGAAGARSVTGAKATFADALPGVDAVYAARTDGVKETVQLKTAAAAASAELRYSIHADASLTASAAGDQVTFRDNNGDAVFGIDAPLAWDSAPSPSHTNAIDLQLEQTEPGKWILTVTPDAAWLSNPTRVLPISVDPDYYWVGNQSTTRFHGADLDCMIQSGTAASNSYCASGLLGTGVGYGRTYKSLLRFDVSKAIPAGSTASSATFRAYANTGNYNATLTRVRTVTSTWDNVVTWNKRNSTTTWTTPSGDVSTDPALIGAPAYVAEGGNWYEWPTPTAAVQGWINGTLPNNGLQLAADPGAANLYTYISTEGNQASWPALDVVWEAPDTTAPSAPTNLKLDPLDPEDNAAYLKFTPGTDPASGNQSVSGVARAEVRIQRSGQAFTAWAIAADGEYLLSALTAGSAINAEARTIDVAGNISPVTAGTFTPTTPASYDVENDIARDYVKSQYGFTDAQANDLLDLQNKSSGLDDAILASSAAANFGSQWYDNEQRKVHVTVTSAATNSTITSIATSAGIPATQLVIDTVADSEGALTAAATTAQTTLASDITAGKVEVGVDTSRSAVVFTVPSVVDSAVDGRVASAKAALTVKTISERDSTTDTFLREDTKCDQKPLRVNESLSFLFCSGELRGGTAILSRGLDDAGACTAAFLAKANSDSARVLVTAGHCLHGPGYGAWPAIAGQPTLTNQFVTSETLRQDGNSDGLLTGFGIGTVRKVVHLNDGHDAGSITLASNTSFYSPFNPILLTLKGSNKVASTTRNARYPVKRVGTPKKNAIVCRTGAKSADTSCGKVVTRGLRGGAAAKVEDMCGQKGDSGGPVYKEGTAFGIVSSNNDKKVGGVRLRCATIIEGAKSAETILGITIEKTAP